MSHICPRCNYKFPLKRRELGTLKITYRAFDILLSLKNGINITTISRKSGVHYKCTKQSLDLFAEKGLIAYRVDPHQIKVFITYKGLNLIEHCLKIKKLLKIVPNPSVTD